MSVQPIPWYLAWAGILRYPSVYNFEVLVLNPNATRRTAYYWMATVGIIANIFNILPLPGVLQQLTGGPQQNVAAVSGAFLLCSLPVAALGSILGLVLAVVPQNLMARLLGGQGSYDQLIYAEAAFSAPLLLVSSVLNMFPYIYLLDIPLAIYSFILSVMAIKAVHQFTWIRAITSGLAPIIFIAIAVLIGVTLFASRGIRF